ncbi:MAG TPA: cupredoxin family protein [Methylococcaceae bacterium]|nr:cupredoxin family protein [Methylococcaceae bacterium]
MNIRDTSLLYFIPVLFAGQASAGGSFGHPGGHGFTYGSPGLEREVSRVIRVEANDEMRFIPGKVDIDRNETIKFIVTNRGQLRHEFAIEDQTSQKAHAEMMKAMPGMVHKDPNAVTLESGETKTVIWKFDKPIVGGLEFACHEPGHYELGMVSRASVSGFSPEEIAQRQTELLSMGDQGSHHSHAGLSWTMGDWSMMFHGVLKGLATEQGGPRGDSSVFLSGDFGLGASRQLGPGTLELTAMLTPDPLMGPRGYPLLFQTGETADGKTPLVDRQHPHDLFMELSASYTHPVTDNTTVRAYFGWPGEPALGPAAPDHRFSGVNIPDVPISHHWMDSTHISFGVATLGVAWKNWALEGSVFNGREPDEHRWNIETRPWTSQSVRLTFNPSDNWSMQVSHGFLASPRQLFPESDTDRTTASITYHKKGDRYEWETLFGWGRNVNTPAKSPIPAPGNTLDAFMLESTLVLDKTHTLFTRVERVDEDGLFFRRDDPLAGKIFTVNKLEVGYVYNFPKMGHIRLGLGVAGSVHVIPHELEDRYTSSPVAGFTFLTAKIE